MFTELYWRRQFPKIVGWGWGGQFSGSRKCALIGVPWRGVSFSPSARGDLSSNDIPEKVLKALKHLRRQGTPMRAHKRPPDFPLGSRTARIRCIQDYE